MNILITGAAGFVGKNLTAALECIRDGRDKTHPGLGVGELYLYDIDSDPALLETACQKADFVFNLAGVNRPKNQEEFMQGNFGFASTLLDTLKKYHNTCPVMLAVSTAGAKKRGRSCSSPMPPKPGRRCWCTASPTCSENGAVPTTIPPWPPSATTMPTTCPSR